MGRTMAWAYAQRTRGGQRDLGRVVALATMLAVVMLTVAAARAAAQPTPLAHAAHSLNGRDTAHLHYTKSSGSLLFEEGAASGTLPGTMHAELNIGATFTGNFTIYTQFGTIKGRGTGTPHGSGRYESFAGTLVVTGGTGRYAHVRGHGGFYGTFDRRTYALVVQTTGKLSY